EDSDLENGRAQADLVAVFEVVIAESLSRAASLVFLDAALTDLLAIHESAVATAEVANANVRGIDIEQAMTAGKFGVLGVIGQTRMAIRIAADDAGTTVDEDIFAADKLALSDCQSDLGRHLRGCSRGTDPRRRSRLGRGLRARLGVRVRQEHPLEAGV